MHHIMNRIHGSTAESTPAPNTRGRTIRWAWAYDGLVRLLTMNREGALRNESIHIAGLKPGASVLDIGCGTGSLTLRAKKAVGPQGTVTGIDAAPEMIKVAQRKARHMRADVRFQVGVVEALEFPDQSFDAVLSSLMFHHLPDDLKSQAVLEAYRVLRPGGVLLIVDFMPNGGSSGMAGMLHRELKSGPYNLGTVMQQAGYTQFELGTLHFPSVGYVKAYRPG